MHTAWIKAKGGLETCPMCNDEHNNPNNPRFVQIDLLTVNDETRFPVPCKRHGDPAIILPGNEDAFRLYFLMSDNRGFRYELEDVHGKNVYKCYLDLNLCINLCKVYDLEPDIMLPKLNIIHQTAF